MLLLELEQIDLMDLLIPKKKNLRLKQLKVIGMLQQHMRYGSKTLGIMLLAQKHFMENFRVDLRIIVFIIPDQI